MNSPKHPFDVKIHKVKVLWELFIGAETGTYEKSKWLDVLLAEILLNYSEGCNLAEILNFCPPGGIVTLIGCELLCGIHRVTSSLNTTPLASSLKELESSNAFCKKQYLPTSSQVLQKYLLKGPAWRCLVVLLILGVDGLSCSRQLSSVLIWLYGELNDTSYDKNHGTNPHVPLFNKNRKVYQLLSDRIWQNENSTARRHLIGGFSNEKGATSVKKKEKYKQDSKNLKIAKPVNANLSDDSYESGNCKDDLESLNRSVTQKVKLMNDECEGKFSPTKSKLKVDDFNSEKQKAILDSEMTIFEFNKLIIKLLQELCIAENKYCSSGSVEILVHCVNFSLRRLCDLQYSSNDSENQNEMEKLELKALLTELLLISLDKTLQRSDVIEQISIEEALPIILRLLKNMIVQFSLILKKNDSCAPISSTQSTFIATVLYGIGISTSALLFSLLEQTKNLEQFQKLTAQFEQVIEYDKETVLRKCIVILLNITAIESEDKKQMITRLVHSVVKFIISLKKLKSKVVHSSACHRSRHKHCKDRLLQGMHHHHFILGESKPIIGLIPNCCVSIMYASLVSLLNDYNIANDPFLRHQILRGMARSGTCCCFPLGYFVENLVKLVLTQNATASKCLSLLEHTLFGELGARITNRVTYPSPPCSVCDSDSIVSKGRRGGHEKKSSFSFLIHYNSLLQLDNCPSVLHSTMHHIERIIPMCKADVQYEMLFSVLYPSFIVAKHSYIIRSDEISFFVTSSCLNIFTNLLHTKHFTEHFIQKGGLAYVLELINIPEFSKQCCSILELTILTELNDDSAGGERNMSIPSINVLLKSLNGITKQCLNTLKLLLEGTHFSSAATTKEFDAFKCYLEGNSHSEGDTEKQSHISGDNSPNISDEQERNIGSHSILKNSSIFWRSCSSLCINSLSFRSIFLKQRLFIDSYKLMRILIQALLSNKIDTQDIDTATKIVEVVLSIHFVLSESTHDISKQLTVERLREVFLSDDVLLGDCNCLKSICDMLLRVASTSVCHMYEMPLPTNMHPQKKEGREEIDEDWSSSDQEKSYNHLEMSGDESARSYLTADEGYEADIEICPRKKGTTERESVSSNEPLHPEEVELKPCDDIEKRSSQIPMMHPELCCLVVEILGKLIEKLLNMKNSKGSLTSESNDVANLAASLAKACCARLTKLTGNTVSCDSAISNSNTLVTLLKGHARLLLSTTIKEYQHLQRSVVDLVHVLGSQCIHESELTLFLQLFKSETCPVPILLDCFAKLIEQASYNMPDFILSFPIQKFSGQERTEHINKRKSCTVSTQSKQATEMVEKISQKLTLKGVESVWSRAACHVTLEGPAPVGLAMWFNPSRRSIPGDVTELKTPENVEASSRGGHHNKLHIISFGQESLLVETWLNTSNGFLEFILTRPEESACKVISETTVETRIPINKWNFIALNVKEIVQKKKIYIQISLFINSMESETCTLPLSGIFARKNSQWCVLVGDTMSWPTSKRRTIEYTYHIANFTFFRAPILNSYNLLYIMAQGPNAAMITTAQMGIHKPNYASLITEKHLHSNLDWNEVYELSSLSVRELQESVLLTFSAQSPGIMNLYHQTISTSSNVFGTRTVGSNVMRTSWAIPETLFVAWRGEPLSGRYRGISPALCQLGGAEVMLFLFAKVVEVETSSEWQAQALAMLLKVCYSDARLYSQFHQQDFFSMIHTVLSTDQCTMSHHMLKVFINAACNSPMMMVANGKFYISQKSEAILVEPAFIIQMISAWKKLDRSQSNPSQGSPHRKVTCEYGEECSENLFDCLLDAIFCLLRDDHPYRNFNVAQANRVHLINHLLTYCKERYLNSDLGALNESTISGIIEVLRSLMGAPPRLCYITQVMDFLLVMHPASETYVTHSRANFYFLLSSKMPSNGGDETNLLYSLNLHFLKKRKPMRKSSASEELSVKTIIRESIKDSDQLSLVSYGESQTEAVDKFGDASSANSELEECSSDTFNSDQLASSCESQRVNSDNVEGNEKDAYCEEELRTEYVVIESDEAERAVADNLDPVAMYHQSRAIASADEGGLVIGVMALLKDAIRVMPDYALIQLCLCERAKMFLAICGKKDSSQRAACVSLLSAMLQRAPQEDIKDLHKVSFVYHLANQLSLYPAEEDLVRACLFLITRCEMRLEEHTQEHFWREVDESTLRFAPPLISLLPRLLHNEKLARTLIDILHTLVDKASVKVLLDSALVEVIVKSALVLRMTKYSYQKELLNDLSSLTVRLMAMILNQPHSLQNAVDVCELLRCGGSSTRPLLSAALQIALSHTYAQATNTHTYFSVVTSSLPPEQLLNTTLNLHFSKSELSNRQKTIAAKTVEHFISTDVHMKMSNIDSELFELLFNLMLIDKSSGWRVEYASELFWWVMTGERLTLQANMLRTLYQGAQKDVLGIHNPSEVSILLSSILRRLHGNKRGISVESCVTDWVREWALSLQSNLDNRLPASRVPRAANAFIQAARTKQRTEKRDADHRAKRSLFQRESLAAKVVESAMSITRFVVDAQNEERKTFLEYLRRKESECAIAVQSWRSLIESNTHELALWYDKKLYPKSWELDPTEGPGRVRVRLRRCHLDIPSRFFNDNFKYKADKRSYETPLSYLVVQCGGRSVQDGLVERLHLDERVHHLSRATLVSVNGELEGDLLLTDRCIHFIGERAGKAETWPLRSVEAVRARRYSLSERAAELFLNDGRAVLLAFQSKQQCHETMTAIHSLRPGDRSEDDSLAEALNEWRSGAITNWEYLMRLNGLAGRSYNDLMQYPVLPFILADYTSKILDLTSAKTYRDLSKPMAVQEKTKESHYLNNYNDLKQAQREGCVKEPYHYGSHYSNSGTVLHFLVRLPPFTKQFLNYQDNNFDIPDRTFHSLATTWRLTSRDSTTDVKELIPEFFYLPEFLTNTEGLNLGIRQCGAAVEDVELPPWAVNARHFILLHRQTLESSYVTENLPHWIDLVFGYKQTGQAAIDSVNVFHPATYYGFDPTQIEDEVERAAWETMVRTYGQTPRQLFKQPHPHRQTDLYHNNDDVNTLKNDVVCGALGIRLGKYAGLSNFRNPSRRRLLPSRSPTTPLGSQVTPGRLQPTPRANSLALGTTTSLIIMIDHKKTWNPASNLNWPLSMALLSWGHSDNMVRLKLRKEHPPEIILHVPGIDLIVCGSSASGGGGIAWLGAKGGGVWAVEPTRGRNIVKRVLPSYSQSSVKSIALSAPFRIAAVAHTYSISVWDMHTHNYIRRLPNKHDLPVKEVCISDTLCDIAAVHDLVQLSDEYKNRYRSLIRVFTVNGQFVGSVKTLEGVNCICYSNAKEGISVNCLAAGLETGAIRLYSSWDLKPMNDLPPHEQNIPVMSLTYSLDSQQIFGLCGDGTLYVWEQVETHSKANNVRIITPQNIF